MSLKFWHKLEAIVYFGIFFAVCIIQLAYNPSTLPLGFEHAKVQILGVLGVFLVLWLCIQFAAYNQKLTEIFAKDKLKLILLALALLTYLLILLSTLTSPYQDIAYLGSRFRLTGIWAWSSIILVFIFALLFTKKSYLRALVNLYLIVIIFHMLLGIADASRLSWEQIQLGFYVNGNYGQANFFGSTLISGAVILLYRLLFYENKIKNKISYLLLLILFLVTTLLSFSYGSWLNITFFSIFLIFNKVLKLNKILQNKVYIINSTLLIIYMVALALATFYFDESRRLFWQATTHLVGMRPVFGFGSDTLSYAFADNGLLIGRLVDRAHNSYLDLVFNFGLAILLPIIIAFALTWSRLKTVLHDKNLQQVCLVVIVFLVTAVMHEKSIYHYAEFALFAGILVSQLKSPSKKSLN